MKTIEELKEFYDAALVIVLKRLEDQRKRTMYKLLGLIVVCVLISVSLLLIGADPEMIAFIVAGSGVLYAWILKSYRSNFKHDLISRLVSFIDNNLSYDEDSFVAESLFRDSQIFRTDFNKYNGDDHVTGILQKTQVEFSELNVIREDGIGGDKLVRNVFKGIFFVADFNKSFSGTTFVLPDVAERVFGRLGTFFQSKRAVRNQLVKLENPDFEKEFVVYSDDQIEARYILSPSLMERILSIQRRSESGVRVAFRSSKMYIAIPREPMLEPKIFSSLLSFGPIRKYFEDLSFAIGLVDDLNLNTRIWGRK